MNLYEGLDFERVKEDIAKHCSFSLSKECVIKQMPMYSYLHVKRDLERGREILGLYQMYGSPLFSGIHDFRELFVQLGKGKILNTVEIYDIGEFMGAYVNMMTYKKSIDGKVEQFIDIVDALTSHVSIQQEIFHKISANYEVKDHATKQLQDIRYAIRSCESEIGRKTNELMSRYSDMLMDQITATRNNRTTLLVKAQDKNRVKGFIHDASASGQAVYIEPEELLVLNNKLQTLRAQEKQEIHRILVAFSLQIQPHCDELLANLETYTLLDVLFSKAKWASEYGAVYAKLEEDVKYLYIKDARHPLIDQRKVVCNTYEIREPHHHVLISGSNTGGKTVTLKTIGLFALLSMSGFPISCSDAVLPCFDGIYVDVGDAQSIVESLSTFSAHISKLAYILEHATSQSLVLLDELGSGTDPREGEYLAIAVLDYLKEHDIMSVATTHYSNVKEYAKVQEEILLSSVGFNVDTMQPTYRYMSGFSGNSNALQIAQRYHLKSEIIQHAQSLRDASYTQQEKLSQFLEQEKLSVLTQKEELDKQARQLQEQQALFKQQQHNFQREQDKQLEKAENEAQRLLEEARQQAKEVIDSLQAKKQIKEHEAIEAMSKLKMKTNDEEETVSDEVFKVHDYVKVKGLQYHGDIVSIKGNRVTIEANGMKMNLKKHELTHMQRPTQQKKQVSISSKSNSSRPSMECNIIGMRVLEGLEVVQKYLDNAMYHKMYNITIIHGSGTGALRNGVHEYLKKNKNVKEYRLGGEFEGGLGVTVVTLRGSKNG